MSKKLKLFFSSKNQNWRTPKKVYDKLDNEFNFDCDPCPSFEDGLRSRDMLGSSWGKSNYVNPPYKNVEDWLRKGYNEYLKGKIVVFLIPSRTDTQWWHNFVMKANQIRFIIGRLKFKGDNDRFLAPFASIIVIFNSNKKYNKKFISYDVNEKELI